MNPEQATASLLEAIRNDKLEDAENALNYGADLRPQTSDRFTPLHLAAELGRKNMVSLLKRMGSLEIENEEGKTPKDLAIENGHTEVGDMLTVRGHANENASERADGKSWVDSTPKGSGRIR